jgi:hypothetical protein
MTLAETLRYLGIWSAVGCIAFSLYVIVVFRTGIFFTARKEDGTLKERIPLSGYFNMLLILVIIVGFQVIANTVGIDRRGYAIGLLPLFLLNYGHYLVLFLFDTVVIDGLVLGVWRPQFLRLPEAMRGATMKEHILKSIPVGIAAGIVLTALSTTISFLMLFKD